MTVQFAPQTIDDIVNSHMLPSSPETGSDENEATKFFNEVERVQAWEQHVVKAKHALARGADRPFINYTTPSDIPWPLDGALSVERPARGKRVRDGDDAESPQAKRRRQPQNKTSRAQAKTYQSLTLASTRSAIAKLQRTLATRNMTDLPKQSLWCQSLLVVFLTNATG